MRLKTKEIDYIKNIINSFFDNAKIYIFGSRLDDSKKGGDIDIYIIANSKENLFKKEAKIKFMLQNILYKQVDILIHKDFKREIEIEALQGKLIQDKTIFSNRSI